MKGGDELGVRGLVGRAVAGTPVNAQELSEKATRTFMEYAWSLTPEAFTKPNGETIQIDKKKKAEVMVPLEVAREVILAGRLSAHAQVCELAQEHRQPQFADAPPRAEQASGRRSRSYTSISCT